MSNERIGCKDLPELKELADRMFERNQLFHIDFIKERLNKFKREDWVLKDGTKPFNINQTNKPMSEFPKLTEHRGIQILMKVGYENLRDGQVKFIFEAEHTRPATEEEFSTKKEKAEARGDQYPGTPIEWAQKTKSFEASSFDYEQGLSDLKKQIDEYADKYL